MVFATGGPQRYVWAINNMEVTAVTRHLANWTGEFAGPIFPLEPWEIAGSLVAILECRRIVFQLNIGIGQKRCIRHVRRN
jgi:hypothetical protein